MEEENGNRGDMEGGAGGRVGMCMLWVLGIAVGIVVSEMV